MGIIFNIDETLQMAIQIEKNGNAFYQKAARATTDNALKKLFKDLANMEDLHEKYFLKLKKELTAKERVQDVYDPDAEGVLYLNAFASGHIFKVDNDPARELTGDETMADILDIAIGLEKDSVVFYLGIKEMVPENLGKAKVEIIIKEEMKHIRLLSEQMRIITA